MVVVLQPINRESSTDRVDSSCDHCSRDRVYVWCAEIQLLTATRSLPVAFFPIWAGHDLMPIEDMAVLHHAASDGKFR